MNTIAAFEFLTPKELKLIQYLCNGWSRRKIAKRYGVTLSTINLHIRQALDKLDMGFLNSRAALFKLQEAWNRYQKVNSFVVKEKQ